jgi:rod shape-determining protein MreD
MLIFSFFLAAVAFLLQGSVLPGLHLLAFAPYVALVSLKCSTPRALWLSAIAGAFIDLFSDDPMGLHALNYTLSCFLLLRLKKHFLFNNPFHLSLFSFLVSSLSTLLQLILLFLFDRRVPFSGRWIFADLVGMPVIDALYAFVWFAAPLVLFERLHRVWVVFWLKKKIPSQTSP